MAVVNKLDIFEKVCRTCNNQPNNLLNIFDAELLGRTSISEMLNCCSQFPISPDDLYPQQICYFCVKKLEITYKFLKQCQQAHAEFDKVLNYCIEKDTNTDSDPEEIKLEINECTSMVEKEVAQKDEKPKKCVPQRYEHYDGCKAGEKCVDSAKISRIPTSQKDEHSTKTLMKHKQNTKQIYGTINKDQEGNEAKVVCDCCTKCFLTTKALQLHIKISHKNKKLKRLQ